MAITPPAFPASTQFSFRYRWLPRYHRNLVMQIAHHETPTSKKAEKKCAFIWLNSHLYNPAKIQHASGN